MKTRNQFFTVVFLLVILLLVTLGIMAQDPGVTYVQPSAGNQTYAYPGTLYVGGGYGSTGCTISDAGAGSFDGLVTAGAGITETGGNVSLNASSNYNFSACTGTSTGTFAAGTGASTQALNYGTGAGVKTNILGSVYGASATTIQSGTGDVTITSTDDIILLTNTGTGENISATNTLGTAANAIAIQATAGGIDMDCAAAKDVDISGGQVLISSKDNAASAIGLTANVGTSETIVVTNTQGTGESAITLLSTAGGVNVDAAAAKDLDLAGGQVKLVSKDNAAGAISLTANIGSSETILITNTQGTSASAINLTATAGGIALNPVAGTPVAVGGEMTLTVPTKFEYLLQSTPLVDVGAVAGTVIYTVPSGKSAVITEIVFRNASGTFDQGTDPVFSIGWNSTDYNNVVSSATYTNAMASAANYFILTPTGKSNATVSTLGTTGQTLKINVTTAATASTTCTVSVFGYLF